MQRHTSKASIILRGLLPPGVLIAAALALFGPAVSESTETGTLRVVVTGESGPLSGALVEVSHPIRRVAHGRFLSDEHGVVEFSSLPVGEGYVIRVTLSGFGARNLENLEVRGGETATVTVELRRDSGGDATIRVTEPARSEFALKAKDVEALTSLGDVGGAATFERRAPMMKREIAAPPPPPAFADEGFSTESYDVVDENGFRPVASAPLSTFSIDVDTASYSNVRRFLNTGRMPPSGAVRIEEMINYFDYAYAQPDGDVPFGVDVEIAEAPWNPKHRLARIGLKGREVAPGQRPPCNLVFLLDVSGSMRSPNKLPLVQRSMKLLVNELNGRDQVSIVVYAGAAGLVLPPTEASDRSTIHEAIDGLAAGGSTAGGAGIQLAYHTAREAFIEGGVNRIVLATDGDFNVGVSDRSSLVEMIEREAESGVELTVLGFGMGNYKDSTLEQLADHGNGNHAYIDSLAEARKVLVEQSGGTLVTIAKDVKIQVEFNPAVVSAYRLIGYENRALRDEDFNDDTKDAGEIGAGHTVTALYEIVPRGVDFETPAVDPLKYRKTTARVPADFSEEAFTVKVRWKAPGGATSRKLDLAATDGGRGIASASDDLRFAAAVAGFGMLLRDSEYVGEFGYDDVIELAEGGLAADRHGHRTGFVDLVVRAKRMN